MHRHTLSCGVTSKIASELCNDFAEVKLGIGRWGSWNETSCLLPTIVLLPSAEISITSRFSIWCIVFSSKTGSPSHPTMAKPNSIKKTLKLSNHARRFAYLVQEWMHISFAWGAIKAQRETFVDFNFYQIYAHLQFFPEVMPQSSVTLMLIFCRGTTTLLTWFICINDSAASMSNLKTCSGSKPHTLEQEALVPKFLDVHHVCVKTFRETHYLIRCDCFFLWKVRNIYMNSMNIQIHALIEFNFL